MVNKANIVLGMIKNSFSYLDTNSMKPLFTSLVRPQLNYAATIWNPNSMGIAVDINDTIQLNSRM